jgi:short-subunit dehydrogenase
MQIDQKGAMKSKVMVVIGASDSIGAAAARQLS